MREPRVGAFTAACLLVSNAVGSGIFTTTGFMARDLGDPRWILLLWALGGVLALAGAMSYGELGAALPRSGGEYLYLRRAFGPLVGFLSGWTSFAIGFGAAIAAAATSFAHYLLEVLPPASPVRAPRALALALIWGLTAVHALGVGSGSRLQRLLALAKIGGIALVLVAGLASDAGSWTHALAAKPGTAPDAGALSISLVFVLYAYSGWNAAAYVAGELRAPRRDLPRATIAGTLFVTVLYLALNAVYLYALPVGELAQEPVLPVARKAITALLGEPAARGVAALLCVSIGAASSAMIWAGPRVYAAMSRDGAAPRFLGHVSASGAPRASVALQSVWASLLVLSGSFERLVVYSGIALAVWSALAAAAVVVLRVREPELPRPYRVAPYPWVPLAYAASSLLVAGYGALARPTESLLAAATVAAGLPLYYVWRKP